ncbi:hemerythrin domain-containing protein [Enhygromyxa salina]|uniref:DNA nickase n=1 Tax=Enhygromyxa salina TaxID=215803 RepID=A0A2S9YM65_9BACT|nr:hemerythrin domain-containing protein [Enhygromyxa salina]PRQ06136.1 DNA nickase [Enhygromyxa salina]
MSKAKTTTNHDIIKRWVEQRGGCPAHVKGTGSDDDPGVLRIDFPGFSGTKTLEPIEWETFFAAFEDNELAFLYQDEEDSRFSKLISREQVAKDSRQGDGKSSAVDAIELLESQHREVESLFAQLNEAGSVREKSELFAELADQLAAHAKIEEQIFYPAMCEDDTAELLHESVEEHLAVKQTIAELLDMEADDPQFMKKIAKLEALVSHHVEEEESQLFVQARAQEAINLDALGRQMKRRFTALIGNEPRREVPNETDTAASLPC